MQRAAEWKVTLREEPKVARLLLRRLIGPLVLTDDSQRPDWIDAEAEIKDALLDGIHDVASPSGMGSIFPKELRRSLQKAA
jgi:hypothetical protein